jgi:hypothetical protein
MRRLGRAGARGIPDYDAWRREAAARAGDLDAAVAAGVDVVNDLDRLRDPVHAGHEELALAGLPGLEPGCVSLLRHHADTRPGVWVPGPPDGARCPRPRIVALANDRFTSMR